MLVRCGAFRACLLCTGSLEGVQTGCWLRFDDGFDSFEKELKDY